MIMKLITIKFKLTMTDVSRSYLYGPYSWRVPKPTPNFSDATCADLIQDHFYRSKIEKEKKKQDAIQ
jgi:hypothetical protein